MKQSKSSRTVFLILAVLLILTVLSFQFASGLFARYLTKDKINDSARVAKWDVNLVDKSGVDIATHQGSTSLEASDSGNNFFQVTNKSEVAAMFAEDSYITLEFTADTFKTTTEITTWDFLSQGGVTIDNPCVFNVYMYGCSYDELEDYIFYTKGSTTLTVEQYNALTETEKAGYKEDVVIPTDSTIKYKKIITTDDPYTLEKRIIDGEARFYIKQQLNPGTDLTNFTYDQTYTFRLEWKINDYTTGEGSVTNKFKAYDIIEKADYNTTKYKGYLSCNRNSFEITEKTGDLAGNSGNQLNSFTVNIKEEGVSVNKEFVIAYRELDYFEYLVYTSSLGGEPESTELDFVYDEIETRSSGIYKTGYSKLTTDIRNVIQSRTIVDVDTTDSNNTTSITYDTLMKYREKLQFDAYTSFLDAQVAFESSLGYLSIGLRCSIIYELKVVQVD